MEFNKQKYIKMIQDEYDKIYISLSGGKDSIATLIWAMRHFDPEIIECLWVDVFADYPECFPYLIYIAEETGVKLNAVEIPVSLYDLCPALGFLSHNNRWCGPEGKFIAIDCFMKKYNGRFITFNGTRWAESRSRQGRPIFMSEKESFVGQPTFHPIIDFSDIKTCNYILEAGLSLQSIYLWFERSGCFICPETHLQDLAVLRKFYPRLFGRYIDYLRRSACDDKWREKYAEEYIERMFKYDLDTNHTFKPPYTAKYVFLDKIEDCVGIKIKDIRDDPDYTFRMAVEDSVVSPDIQIHETKPTERLFMLKKKAEDRLRGFDDG